MGCVCLCVCGGEGGVTDLVAFVGFDIHWALDFLSLLHCQVQLVKVKHSLFPVGIGGLWGWKNTNRVHYNNIWVQLASLNFSLNRIFFHFFFSEPPTCRESSSFVTLGEFYVEECDKSMDVVVPPTLEVERSRELQVCFLYCVDVHFLQTSQTYLVTQHSTNNDIRLLSLITLIYLLFDLGIKRT